MSRLHFVIFGATGFTGKHAVQEMCRIAKTHKLTWGVAGRSQTNLEEMLKNISKKTDEDLSSVKIIVADVEHEKSLKDMCAQTTVLVNCCGPFIHYGEPVVRTAIDSKTHYVDISGEPQFIQTMQVKYDKAARDAGVYVINACGFYSIPQDMAVIFLQENFGGTLNSVESYLSTHTPGQMTDLMNYGSWKSIIYGYVGARVAYEKCQIMTNLNQVSVLTNKQYPEKLPTFKPKLKTRCVFHKKDDEWCLPFPSCDASIVYRTQRYLYETEHRRPVQIKTYAKFHNFLAALTRAFITALVFLMTNWTVSRKLLLKYPRLFSFGFVCTDPREQAIRSKEFMFELYGEGWEAGSDVNTPPNKKMTAKVSGVNPGYGATVVALLYSAITILQQKDNMPHCGVLTPGIAFRNTDIIKRLHENNLKFQIVDDKNY